MKFRMEAILAVAAKQKEDALVLGAWGCGVFGNNPRFVAEEWRRLLVGKDAKYANVFAVVVMAVLDFGAIKSTLNAFKQAFT